MSRRNKHITTLSDEKLVLLYQESKDKNCIGELFTRYSPLVMGVCLKYLKNVAESQDMLMLIFEKLIKDLPKNEVRNFKPWLYQITKNQCLMLLRKKKNPHAQVEEMELAATENNIEEKQIKEIVKLRKKTDKKIGKLHKTYLKNLAKYLTTDKIDAVKDGMTYGVVPKTYFAFQDMLPNLTEAQKEFIYKNLVEAREHAMDAGSSKEKHAWFGKYKGRINNYLSKEGYDLNKESEDWHKRIEARKKESAQ